MPLYRTNASLLIKGDRIERDREIELTPGEAAAFDPADLTKLSGAPEPEPEPLEEPLSLGEMTLSQLKDRAKEHSLPTGGSKADLLERLSLLLESDTDARGYQAGFGADRKGEGIETGVKERPGTQTDGASPEREEVINP